MDIQKKTIKSFLFLLLIFFISLSIASAAAVDINDNDKEVYANGDTIIIYDGNNGNTFVKTSDGGFDPKKNITGYTIYGGSKSNSYGSDDTQSTSITMTGGTVGDIYGGNKGDPSNEEASLNTHVSISGGNATSVYGGNKDGALKGSTLSVHHSGGIVGNIYGGSENGDISDSELFVHYSNGKVGTIYGGSKDGDISDSELEVFVEGCEAEALINTIYGGSENGDILKIHSSNKITVTIESSAVYNVYGGSKEGNIEGDIFVHLNDSTFAVVHGGSKGNCTQVLNQDFTPDQGKPDQVQNSKGEYKYLPHPSYGHTGTIKGDISVVIQNSSGSVVYGASELSEVYGNVNVHVNACTICDEGETEAESHTCTNVDLSGNKVGTSKIKYLMGGGGNNTGATRNWKWINSGNVYGDTKLVVAGDTNISERLMGGGRQGNVRKALDNSGKPTNDGGNVLLIIKGNTDFLWSCAAGYCSHYGVVVEGDVDVVIGGTASGTQFNGGGEVGGVGGEITATIKENAEISSVYGGAPRVAQAYFEPEPSIGGLVGSVGGGELTAMEEEAEPIINSFYLLDNYEIIEVEPYAESAFAAVESFVYEITLNDYGTGISDSEMKSLSTFKIGKYIEEDEWSISASKPFETIWYISEGKTYPKLSWAYVAPNPKSGSSFKSSDVKIIDPSSPKTEVEFDNDDLKDAVDKIVNDPESESYTEVEAKDGSKWVLYALIIGGALIVVAVAAYVFNQRSKAN